MGHTEWCMAISIYVVILGIMANVFIVTGYKSGLFYLIPLFTGFFHFIEMIHVQWGKITKIHMEL